MFVSRNCLQIFTRNLLFRDLLFLFMVAVFLFSSLTALLFSDSAFCEVIHFKNGKFLVGEVFPDEDRPGFLKIEVEHGFVRVRETLVERTEELSEEEEPLPPMEFGQTIGLQIESKKYANGTEFGTGLSLDRGAELVREEQGEESDERQDSSVASGRKDLSVAIKVVLGKIGDVNGQAEIRKANSNWQNAKPGDTLSPGDELRTLKGRVKVHTSEQDELRLTENTLVKNPLGKTKPIIDLLQGRLWANV